jgi:hypothetical protein
MVSLFLSVSAGLCWSLSFEGPQGGKLALCAEQSSFEDTQASRHPGLLQFTRCELTSSKAQNQTQPSQPGLVQTSSCQPQATCPASELVSVLIGRCVCLWRWSLFLGMDTDVCVCVCVCVVVLGGGPQGSSLG